jgi:hypothetical protein
VTARSRLSSLEASQQGASFTNRHLPRWRVGRSPEEYRLAGSGGDLPPHLRLQLREGERMWVQGADNTWTEVPL